METLDKCFENVCELDLIFHMDKVGCRLYVLLRASTWLLQSPALPAAPGAGASLGLWSLWERLLVCSGSPFGEILRCRWGSCQPGLTLCPPDERSELLGSVLSPWDTGFISECLPCCIAAADAGSLQSVTGSVLRLHSLCTGCWWGWAGSGAVQVCPASSA